MKSPIIKRSVMIDGHKTSISLEDAFWSSLKAIADAERATVSKLVAKIDKTRKKGNCPPQSVYLYSTASAMDKRVSSGRHGRPEEMGRPENAPCDRHFLHQLSALTLSDLADGRLAVVLAIALKHQR